MMIHTVFSLIYAIRYTHYQLTQKRNTSFLTSLTSTLHLNISITITECVCLMVMCGAAVLYASDLMLLSSHPSKSYPPPSQICMLKKRVNFKYTSLVV
mmetsp:Transcript_13140/g.27904  ORF Transcript_13140/g.27904 Transcript_13140/m.27904 type:complete len:98 (+) Transcript_13140:173-466(+)